MIERFTRENFETLRYEVTVDDPGTGELVRTREGLLFEPYARDIAETKATRATDAGRRAGYPLLFTTEPEE